MESAVYTREQANDLFESHYAILDQIADLIQAANDSLPLVDHLLEQGHLPAHWAEDGTTVSDAATGGAWMLQYVA